MKYRLPIFLGILCICTQKPAFANKGVFDLERWDTVIENIRTKAAEQKISQSVIDETLKSPSIIPGIIKSDKNQSEFTLTLDEYLNRTVSTTRIKTGRQKAAEYPTLLGRVENKYGIPRNVMLAFWGMESNYGAIKSKHQLINRIN